MLFFGNLNGNSIEGYSIKRFAGPPCHRRKEMGGKLHIKREKALKMHLINSKIVQSIFRVYNFVIIFHISTFPVKMSFTWKFD